MPTINTRVKNKHDTEANWSKSNLIPLNGEIIIFEADDNTPYPRFKVGDGETNINNLPFTDSDYVKQDELGNYVTTDNVNQSINNKCILYTEAQSLTEEQKAQARNNIGVDSGGGGNNIANATVTLGASLTFNGSEQEQTITSVTLNGETLAEGTDYDISGNVATNAGNYTLIVSGKGDYTGFVFVDWSIAKAQGSISVSESEVDIIGAVGTQKQVTVVIGNGYGDLVVSSSAPDKVTASLVGNAIMLTSVAEGNATISITLVGNYQAQATISVMTALAYSTLADNTPATIRYIADNDLGANYWAVGDTYPVPLNGTDGTELGLTDEAWYIKYGSCGQFVQTTRAEAIGVAFKGNVYNLLGHNDIAEAETVIVSRASTADELTAQRDLSAITFVLSAEKGDIDDATATEHMEVFSPWVYPKLYAVGKIVQDGGKLYKCVQEHTSQEGWKPADTPALWTKIGDPTEEYPEWSQPIGAHDAYAQGAKVSHNDKKWTSDVANNVWEPGVYGWTEVVE